MNYRRTLLYQKVQKNQWLFYLKYSLFMRGFEFVMGKTMRIPSKEKAKWGFKMNTQISKNIEETTFNGIDLFKFIGVFLICSIHISIFPDTDSAVFNYLNSVFSNCIARVAVPFYFSVTGFLLFRKTSLSFPDKNRVKMYCFKILRLLGIWTLLLFIGYKGHLWYLGATVVAVSIIFFLLNFRLSIKCFLCICALLYCIGLLGNSYYGLIEPLKTVKFTDSLFVLYGDLFKTTRNGVFLGVPFVFMGALLGQYRIQLKWGVATTGLIASFVVLFFEYTIISRYSKPIDFDIMLSLLPTSFFLLYFAVNIKLTGKKVYHYMRIVAMLVYCLHMFVKYFVDWAEEFILNHCSFVFGGDWFFIIISFTILLSILIIKLSELPQLHWLSYLYS